MVRGARQSHGEQESVGQHSSGTGFSAMPLPQEHPGCSLGAETGHCLCFLLLPSSSVVLIISNAKERSEVFPLSVSKTTVWRN